MPAANSISPTSLKAMPNCNTSYCCAGGLLLRTAAIKVGIQFPWEELCLIYEMASVSVTQRQPLSRGEPVLFPTQWPQHQQLACSRNHLSTAKYTKRPQGVRNWVDWSHNTIYFSNKSGQMATCAPQRGNQTSQLIGQQQTSTLILYPIYAINQQSLTNAR